MATNLEVKKINMQVKMTKSEFKQVYELGWNDAWNMSMRQKNLSKFQINRVIFTLGTKKDDRTGESRNVLTTVVFFKDNVKCTVQNSIHDTISLNEDGTVTEASKEAGVSYAVTKYVYGLVDKNGNVVAPGFGRLMKTVIENAYDSSTADAKAKAAKAKRKEEHDARQKKEQEAKKKRKPSLADGVNKLNSLLEILTEKLQNT